MERGSICIDSISWLELQSCRFENMNSILDVYKVVYLVYCMPFSAISTMNAPPSRIAGSSML